jgi:hypothetical protein
MLHYEPDAARPGWWRWVQLENDAFGDFRFFNVAADRPFPAELALPFDHDGDGWTDILQFEVTVQNTGHWIRLRNQRDKTYAADGLAVGGLTKPLHALVVDYNRDGATDLLHFELTSPTNGRWVRLRNPGDGTLHYDGRTAEGVAKPVQALLIDYNADGAMDVVEFEETGPGVGRWLRLRNTGSGTLSFDGFAVTGMATPVHAMPVDYNRDGALDLLEFERTGPGVGRWVRLRNPGNGTYLFDGFAVTGLTTPSQSFLVDSDLDGAVDIIEFESTGPGIGRWVLLRNNGNGTFAYSRTLVGGLAIPSVVIMDGSPSKLPPG